ncbi:hypothetical protein NEOC65_001348 [Neochlamydia sp. AcF65]|nr:hypothetical protein [Neochlamydia sp. AcF65]
MQEIENSYLLAFSSLQMPVESHLRALKALTSL